MKDFDIKEKNIFIKNYINLIYIKFLMLIYFLHSIIL